MAALTAKDVLLARSPSDWVHKIWLLCDDSLAVQFRRGQKVKKVRAAGPGAYRGQGGIPGLCCHYPGTRGSIGNSLFAAARVWPYAGEWVHRFLYRKYGYRSILPPVLGDCGVQTSCCPDVIPSTLHATLGGAYSGTVVLTWDSPSETWKGSHTLCNGKPSTFLLQCGGQSKWLLALTASGGCTTAQTTAASSTCSPLSVSFNLSGDGPATCCWQTAFRVTVTP